MKNESSSPIPCPNVVYCDQQQLLIIWLHLDGASYLYPAQLVPDVASDDSVIQWPPAGGHGPGQGAGSQAQGQGHLDIQGQGHWTTACFFLLPVGQSCFIMSSLLCICNASLVPETCFGRWSRWDNSR